MRALIQWRLRNNLSNLKTLQLPITSAVHMARHNIPNSEDLVNAVRLVDQHALVIS